MQHFNKNPISLLHCAGDDFNNQTYSHITHKVHKNEISKEKSKANIFHLNFSYVYISDKKIDINTNSTAYYSIRHNVWSDVHITHVMQVLVFPFSMMFYVWTKWIKCWNGIHLKILKSGKLDKLKVSDINFKLTHIMWKQ